MACAISAWAPSATAALSQAEERQASSEPTLDVEVKPLRHSSGSGLIQQIKCAAVQSIWLDVEPLLCLTCQVTFMPGLPYLSVFL